MESQKRTVLVKQKQKVKVCIHMKPSVIYLAVDAYRCRISSASAKPKVVECNALSKTEPGHHYVFQVQGARSQEHVGDTY